MNALKSLLASALAVSAMASQAAVVSISADDFRANAGQVTFAEAATGTLNPTFTPSQYGGSGTAPTISFASFFLGQRLGVVGAGGDCVPGVASGLCIAGSPSGPLALDPDGGLGAQIGTDDTHTNSPVLFGAPTFNGSIAMLFSESQAAISFDAGFFNTVGSTRITAYGRDGAVLGSILNTATGVQNLIIGANDGLSPIAGLLISLVLPDEAGFSIDNLRFGTYAPPPPPNGNNGGTNGVPEPGSLALVGLALLGAGAVRRRKTAA